MDRVKTMTPHLATSPVLALECYIDYKPEDEIKQKKKQKHIILPSTLQLGVTSKYEK